MIVAMAMLMPFLNCSRDRAWGESSTTEPDEEISNIIGWRPLSSAENDSINAEFVRENGEVEFGSVCLKLYAEDTIVAKANNCFECLDNLAEGKIADTVVKFKYNHNQSNKLQVEGLRQSFKADGTVYIDLPCLDTLRVCGNHGVVLTDNTNGFYEISETQYTLSCGEYNLATATQVFLVDEDFVAPPEYDHTEWSYSHKAFHRIAKYENAKISVICDNVANFKDIYTDGSEQNIEIIDYKVKNYFDVVFPVIVVDNINDVVGETYNIVDNVANIAGTQVKVNWVSAQVQGNIVHGSKDYTDSITPCRAYAKTITINSDRKATIKFYGEDESDYAVVTLNIKISEDEVVIDTIHRSFVHRDFIPTATVAGNSINVVCNNDAIFVKEYSDGTSDNPVTVGYTVTNKFNYYLPTFVVNNISEIVGQSANFVGGTAVVLGKSITTSFVNREISSIMFDGVDYRNEAPQCQVTAKSIEIISSDQAVISFEHDGNVVATATVPVSVEIADIIPGDVISIVVTDHYNGRQLMGVGVHARRADGTVYSFELGSDVNSGTVTTTSVEGTYAWYYYQGQYHLGTVEAEHIADPSAPTEWVLWYYTLEGQVALALGYAEATLNGQGFRNPIHEVIQNGNGIYNVTINGNTYYFAAN